MGVGETGQIKGKTGVGETGGGEMGVIRLKHSRVILLAGTRSLLSYTHSLASMPGNPSKLDIRHIQGLRGLKKTNNFQP